MGGEPKRAVVVGAGIGGLAAGLALKRSGWNVTVLEQAPSARELGFAVLLAPNAMRALRLLGVADEVAKRGTVIGKFEIRRGDGRPLKRIDLLSKREELEEDTVCALRPALHGVLFSALGESALRTGARAVSFQQEAGEAAVTLEDGTRLTGQLLVGADGIHSTVRRGVCGDEPLRPSGFTAFRGVARGATSVLGEVEGAQYLGPDLEAGIASAGADTVYWFVSARQESLSAEGASPKQTVLARVQGLDPAFVSLVERTDPADLRRDDLFDRPRAKRWSVDRVTLLGDAAHPMLPNAGQGAAQAIEDAVVLDRCLSAEPDVPRALARYETVRLPRTDTVVGLARMNARFGHMDGFGRKLRDRAIRLAPASLILSRFVALARLPLET